MVGSNPAAVTFHLYSLRFDFTAIDSIRFPAGKPGNILRGALGTIFRKLVCTPECKDVKTCERRVSCPYARIFEPSAIGSGPSGLSDWPRPFVFRAGHLDGTVAHPKEAFHFDLNLFEMRDAVIPHFARAFAELATEGLGAHRGRANLRAVYQLDEAGMRVKELYDGERQQMNEPVPPLAFEIRPGAEAIEKLQVRFVTPTELKSSKRLAERPTFPVLFGRARDRISTLRTLYQGGALDIDFKAMGHRAAAVRMTRCKVQWRDIMRHSTKTGQNHPIGGFVGEAEYEGDLTEFIPFLHLGQWTGVGRHTVWGKGAIRVTPL